MNIFEKIESEIEYEIGKDKYSQLEKLSQFDNLSDEEIKLIASKGHKSTQIGILMDYLGPEKLHKYFPEFLTFLQDLNWPAAGYASEMFRRAGGKAVNTIKKVFIEEENDDIWKYNILLCIVQHWEIDLIKKLKLELIYIIDNENHFWNEGVSILSLSILIKHNLITKSDAIKYLKNIES